MKTQITECTKEISQQPGFIEEPGYPEIWQELIDGQIRNGGELFFTNKKRVVRETGGFWPGGFKKFLRDHEVV